ncbi:hypothetical protein KU43P_39850 [Pseudomonas sp. KU43P]|nr:hypothetical protein KU43P_39850 [Pseudomonas sp. KU43P]
MAGGGSEYLAAGTGQGDGSTEDTKTGHCISFREGEAIPQSRAFCSREGAALKWHDERLNRTFA